MKIFPRVKKEDQQYAPQTQSMLPSVRSFYNAYVPRRSKGQREKLRISFRHCTPLDLQRRTVPEKVRKYNADYIARPAIITSEFEHSPLSEGDGQPDGLVPCEKGIVRSEEKKKQTRKESCESETMSSRR